MSIKLEDIKDLDAIFVPEIPVMERAFDKRTIPGSSGDSRYYVKDYQDWRVWSGAGFGQSIASSLSNMGKGFAAEVTDFGDCCVIRASYHNTATGRGVEKTYAVLFADPDKGDGRIMISSTKWRSFSNYSQVANYISGVIRSLANETSNTST